MAWFQVDDQLSFHPKVIQAGNAAMGMWVRAGAWSQAHLTEGHIPTEQAKALGGVALAKKLVAAGLWIADDERGGYLFHEWDSRQMSADEIAERRAMRARAGAKGGKASAQSRRAKAEAKRQASASPGGDVSEMESCNDFGENESKTQTRNADRVTTQESRRKPRPPGDMSKSSQASAEASGSANVKQNPTPAPVPTQEASNEASPDSPTDDDLRNVGSRESSSSFSDGTPIPDEPPRGDDREPVMASTNSVPDAIETAARPPRPQPSSAAKTVVRQELGVDYPRTTVDQLAVGVDRLAHQHIADDVIREALREFERRPGAKPSWLESIAGDVVQNRRSRAAPNAPTKPSKFRGIAELAAAARAEESAAQQQKAIQ